MKLLPGCEHLATPNTPAPTSTRDPVVRSVATVAQVEEFLARLRSRPINAVAIAFASDCCRPMVTLSNGKEWRDVRSLAPCYAALAARHCDDAAADAQPLVVDARRPDGPPAILTALSRRVPVIAHDCKAILFALWTLGCDTTNLDFFDTKVAAQCLHLGRHHHRGIAGADHAMAAERELRDEHAHLLSLQGQCAHYQLGYPYSSTDATPQQWLGLGSRTPNGNEIQRLADEAIWNIRLHDAQQRDVLAVGLHSHLHTVEFPFTLANARIEWLGVPTTNARLRDLASATHRAAEHHAATLAAHGVVPAGSREQFLTLMRQQGLLAHMQRDGGISTEDAVLEAVEHLHPAIRAFRLHSRYRRLAGEEWLTGALLGADGRLHPVHTQLGAATGRNSCSSPNLAGIGRALRPVVTAPPGRALVELDYAQIEVGVAAAHHDDSDLIVAFNSGDVYAAMAQRFYGDQLTEAERRLLPTEFKRQRPDLRDRIKTFVLAVLYNIQPPSIATRFGISVEQATTERERFLGLYPKLRAGLETDSQIGAARGYATMVTGLRRHVPSHAAGTHWATNFLRNTPIQGSAAVVFKRAIVLLDREFAGTTIWIVLPVHDSVLIECDIEDVDSVCTRATALMQHALRSYYPKLLPRVDVNKSDVTCWNKDGHSDSLDRFLFDADASVTGPPRLRLHHCAAQPSGPALSPAPFTKLLRLVGGLA